MIKFNLVRFFLVIAMVSGSTSALAHGVKIQQREVKAIALQAQYESGEPMAGAQVLVYSPDNPEQPWLTGTTDDKGKFLFTPDGDRPGNWQMMIRQAGHGSMVTIPVQAKAILEEGSEVEQNGDVMESQKAVAMASMQKTELSPTQQWLSMGAIVWGFIGTALFFSKTRGKA